MKKTLLIILAVVVIIGAWFWTSYNKLVTRSEQVDNAWAQVETQYQRRFDLIPNLVASVQGAMNQEQKIFGDLAAARANYTGASTVNAKAEAATQVESAFGRLLAIMENYPEVKSTQAVQDLMVQIEGTENRVATERGRFNEEVRSYNILTKRFPMNLAASIYGYFEKAYFEAAPESVAAPVVDLNQTN